MHVIATALCKGDSVPRRRLRIVRLRWIYQIEPYPGASALALESLVELEQGQQQGAVPSSVLPCEGLDRRRLLPFSTADAAQA